MFHHNTRVLWQLPVRIDACGHWRHKDTNFEASSVTSLTCNWLEKPRAKGAIYWAIAERLGRMSCTFVMVCVCVNSLPLPSPISHSRKTLSLSLPFKRFEAFTQLAVDLLLHFNLKGSEHLAALTNQAQNRRKNGGAAITSTLAHSKQLLLLLCSFDSASLLFHAIFLATLCLPSRG